MTVGLETGSEVRRAARQLLQRTGKPPIDDNSIFSTATSWYACSKEKPVSVSMTVAHLA